jgi:hypothetical protein
LSPSTIPIDEELAEEISQFYADPLGFVLFAYPWGEKGTPLALYDGPDQWQREFLRHLGEEVRKRSFDGLNAVEPIRAAASSGHGIGKSTMSAWLTDWILSTRPNSQGTVTANKFTQLRTKTWAAIQRWTKLCITSHWFDVGSDRIRAKQAPDSWFVSAQTCREENSESFAGQHAADSTSWYLFDEASAIPDAIWEVAEGGLTDGEPMIFAWGNPTRNSGKFHRIMFGSERGRWNTRVIDSRTSKFTNKELIQEWLEDYGEDSDFFRVRVRGVAPRASDLQYIDSDRIFAAQKANAIYMPDEPLIVGVDVARGGNANTVIRFRRGRDASTIAPIRINGQDSRDSMRIAAKLMEVMQAEYGGIRPAAAFVDSGFGGPIVDRCRQLGQLNVIEISFGAAAPDHRCANMRAYMWMRMRDWLTGGAIDKRDTRLETDLAGPEFHHNREDQLVLEAKESMQKRGLDSPDDGDALALTFAQVVAPSAPPPPPRKSRTRGTPHSWMA